MQRFPGAQIVNRIPGYAIDPVDRFVESLQSDLRLLHLSTRGIGLLTGMPGVLEVLLRGSNPEDAARLTADVDEAKEEAELAENERRTGFPLLHEHALVALWAALEAAIEDMLVGIMLNEPLVLTGKAFAKIRIPLAEFETSEKEERMRFLIAELGRNIGRAKGVDAFEGLLVHFDLSGEVGDRERKMIWQMQHLRDVLVHRAARADRRLVEACPWLNLAVNDHVNISSELVRDCANALIGYGWIILRRLAKRYGVDVRDLIPGTIPSAEAKATGEFEEPARDRQAGDVPFETI